MIYRFFKNLHTKCLQHFNTSWKQISILFILLLSLGLTSCSKTIKIESISVPEEVIEMDVHDDFTIPFTVSPKDADISNIEIKSDKEIIVTQDDTTLHIESGSTEGNYTLYMKADKIESNLIKVQVVDKERVKKEEEAKKAAEEEARKAEEKKKAEEAAAKKAEEEKALQTQQNAVQSQSQTESQQVPSDPIEATVWIASSGNGTKYHSNPNCSRMKNPYQITKSEAIAQGYGPCKKCY